MVKEIPLEVLVQIFSNIKEGDSRQCLLVNKFWSRAARMLIDQSIHLTMTEKSTLYQDLLQFPLLARRVTGFTINSNDTLYCIMTLSLCPNVLNLEFDKCSPNRLLDRLVESEFTLLPKIQEISAGPGDYFATNILWPCIWKHRATITKISTYGHHDFIQKYAKDLPEFISHFPQLEDLHVVGLEANLHRILSFGKNLRKISLYKATACYDNTDNPDASLKTNLEELSIFGSMHISVIQFLVGISNPSNVSSQFQIKSRPITVYEGEDIDEQVKDIIKHFHIKQSKNEGEELYAGYGNFIWKKS